MTAYIHPTLSADLDPATLFGLLWPSVEPYVSDIIQDPWDPGRSHEYGAFYDALIDAPGAAVPPDFIAYLGGDKRGVWKLPPTAPEKRAFLIMRVIDRAFRLVLPETAYALAGAVSARPGELMRRMKDRWFIDGSLAEVGVGFVTLLGPLTSAMRSEAPEARNGDLFEHQFVNITLVTKPGAGRTIGFRTLAPSEFMPTPGLPDMVGVAPIAQDKDDLAFVTEVREPRCYLDARPADSSATAARAIDVVGSMLARGATLVALPELVMDKDVIGEVRSSIRPGPHSGGRVLVLGTGLSEGASTGEAALHYNEAIVCDGRGRVLFSQRKINHYSMSPERMRECSIDPKRDEAHIENCATGHELMVCDLPGVGRLMVLICEDFAQETPGRGIAQSLMPDWIITPVLDIALSPGRWTHQKSFSLGIPARMVVSGSTTLSVRKARVSGLANLDPSSGVAMMFDGRAGAAGRLVTAGCLTGVNAHAVVEWDTTGWPTTRLELRPRAP